ncbi:MAG: TlyA family RNA methyltransferase [Chthoniobacterales bacterium]
MSEKSDKNKPKKLRVDQLLLVRGLVASREKAQRLIMANQVRVEGQPVDKSGRLVSVDAELEVLEPEKYVGRGGLKLEGALEKFGVEVAGKRCLDVGSSTGGFTDCLLQAGAGHVFAVDVGQGQMDWKLRQHPQVTLREGVNARYLAEGDFEKDMELLVADVSFISLTLVLPPAFQFLVPAGDAVVLIKPQFELERRLVGRGGVVRDDTLRKQAVEKIQNFARVQGWKWRGLMESPISGMKGNREFLAHLSK